VVFFSVFAGLAGGGRPIAVMNAALQENSKDKVKPRDNTAKLRKGKKPTEKLKTVVVIA
jgi:hypothetical protein